MNEYSYKYSDDGKIVSITMLGECVDGNKHVYSEADYDISTNKPIRVYRCEKCVLCNSGLRYGEDVSRFVPNGISHYYRHLPN
jgi:hypothetical protein